MGQEGGNWTGGTGEGERGDSTQGPNGSPDGGGPSNPYPYSPQAPKPRLPQSLPTASDLKVQTSESSRPIPLVYGTAKIAGNLLERTEPFQILRTTVPEWTPSTAFARGDICYSGADGHFYLCVVGGTTGTPAYGLQGNSAGIVDGTCTWDVIPSGYRQQAVIGLCEGPIAGVSWAWSDKHSIIGVTGIQHYNSWIALLLGTQPQTRPVFASAETDTYSNTAVVMVDGPTGANNQMPSYSFEVQGLYSSGTDASPADIATDLLTHARRGRGLPSSIIDTVSTGTGAASWRTYCTAAGLNVSWAIEQQQTVLDLLGQLCQVTNTDCVYSGGRFKWVPLGDQAITANGVTYTPDATAVYHLSTDDFLDPVQVSRKSATDVYNDWPVQYIDRTAKSYASVIVSDPDMADVEARGLRTASTTVYDFVVAPDSAIMLSRILAQRSIHVRNSYTVRVSMRYLLLEPTDLITLTDPVMGLARLPVRIVEMSESIDRSTGAESITLTCEDWPAAIASAAKYTPQAGDGYQPNMTDPLNGIVLGTEMLPDGTITDAKSTRGANVDNLFPNGNSEQDPPDGADLTSPEWAWRYNVGVGVAPSGAWIRRAVVPTTEQLLSIRVPCSPGDSFYISALACILSGSTGASGVYMAFLDSSGTDLTGGSLYNQTLNTVYTAVNISGTAPAASVVAVLGLYVTPNSQGFFDAIYARRMVGGEIIGAGAVGSTQMADGSVTSAKQGFVKHYSATIYDDEGIRDVTIDTQPDTSYAVSVMDVYAGGPKHTVMSGVLKYTDHVSVYRKSVDGLSSTAAIGIDIVITRAS